MKAFEVVQKFTLTTYTKSRKLSFVLSEQFTENMNIVSKNLTLIKKNVCKSNFFTLSESYNYSDKIKLNFLDFV